MSEPTKEAMRAGTFMSENPWIERPADIAEEIDRETGLPALLAQRDALLAACRRTIAIIENIRATDGFRTVPDVGYCVGPSLGRIEDCARAAIALCEEPR